MLMAVGSLTNRTGKIRYWVCATEDKRNGVWASVERLVGFVSAPSLPPAANQFLIPANPNNEVPIPTENSTDGREQDFQDLIEGFPGQGQERVVRLSMGYTIDGVDTTVDTRDCLSASNTVSAEIYLLELAVDGEAVTSAGKPDMVRAASVLFWNSRETPPEVAAFSFDIDRRAATSAERHLQSRCSLVDIEGAAEEMSNPLNVGGLVLNTAVATGFSPIPPLPSGRPTGVVPYGVNQPFGNTVFNFGYLTGEFDGFLFDDTDIALRCDIADVIPFSIKNAPCWHEQRLIAHGTQKAVDGSSNSLQFALPQNGSQQPTVQIFRQSASLFGPTVRFQVFLSNFGFLFKRAFTVSPEINGRPLMPCMYHGVFDIPEVQFSGTVAGFDSYAFSLSGKIQAFVRTQRVTAGDQEFNRREVFLNQFPTMAEALQYGIEPDAYFFYKSIATAGFFAGPRTRKLMPGRIQASFLAKLKLTFTYLGNPNTGEWTGSVVAHRSVSSDVWMDMEDAVCANLANGQAVSATLSGIPYGTSLGTPSNFTASVSIP
jgi:hypothetical protein